MTGVRTERGASRSPHGVLRDTHGRTRGDPVPAKRQAAQAGDRRHPDVGQLVAMRVHRDVSDVEFARRQGQFRRGSGRAVLAERQLPQVEVIAHADVVHGATVRRQRGVDGPGASLEDAGQRTRREIDGPQVGRVEPLTCKKQPLPIGEPCGAHVTAFRSPASRRHARFGTVNGDDPQARRAERLERRGARLGVWRALEGHAGAIRRPRRS